MRRRRATVTQQLVLKMPRPQVDITAFVAVFWSFLSNEEQQQQHRWEKKEKKLLPLARHNEWI